MDYDSPLFIAAVKKILRDRVEYLADQIKNLEHAVNAHWQADEERYQTKPVSVTDFRTNVPVQVQTEPKRGKPERIWRRIIGTLEAAAFLAILGYTFLAYQQWRELIAAANAAYKQADFARKTFSETRDNFRLDQRPWVGVLEMDATIPTRESMKVKLKFINSGKTPALNQHLGWQACCYPVGQKPKIIYREDIKDQGAIVLPNQPFWAVSEAAPLCSEKNFELFKQGKADFSVLGTIWYKDEFAVHHTTDFCLYLRVSKSEAKKQPTEEKDIEPQICDYHNSAN
jgi:hypothetical protein